MNVKIIIKSATQSVEDFSMDCDLTWTIGLIKEKIAESYPTNPKKETQKLIYGGKLLPDHLSLQSVLNHSQERHIIHLVCPSPSKANTNNTNDSKQAAPSQSFTVPPTNPAFAPLNQPLLNPPAFSSGMMPGMPVGSINAGDPFQQYLAMQQMYAQFMTQYMSQYTGGVPPVIPYAPVMAVPPVQMPQVPPPQQNLTPNRPQRQADEEDRDYLDYLYIISRAVMLFAVLYYYSSLSRVLIVVSMFLFISIYVKLNRDHQQQQQQQRQANERQREESASTQPAPSDIQTTGNEENVPSSPAEGENATNNETLSQESEGRNFTTIMTTTVSLISAFFSSLIPADPVPVNVN